MTHDEWIGWGAVSGFILFAVLAALFVLTGCTYTYRDYYQAGCCVNQTIEKQSADELNVRPDTHP